MPACGAILDLPEPMIGDPNGSADGSTGTNDGQILVDGELPDGALPDGFVPPTDGSADGPNPGIDGGPLCAGKSCFGGNCVNDKCEPVAFATMTSPGFIDYDSTNDTLYVTSASESIYGIDQNGAVATTPIITGEPGLSALKVLDPNIYFANTASGHELVSRCPTAGCSSSAPRTDYASGSYAIGGIALNSTTLFYGDGRNSGAGGGVYACSVAGDSCSRKLMLSEVTNVTADDNYVSWTTGINNNGIYSALLSSFSAQGTGVYTSVTDFKIQSGQLYFSTDQTITKEAEPAINDVNPIKSSLHMVEFIAVDGTEIYWIDELTTTPTWGLYHCTIATCEATAEEITTPVALGDPGGMVMGKDSLFYTTTSSNTVWRLAKR
jgi:hypothetical protein